jgi:hypothetical protein
MARHESEMHRHRAELQEALRSLLFCLDSPSPEVQRAAALFQPAIQKARATLKATLPRCDHGLFGDHSQMNLQDRKDI